MKPDTVFNRYDIRGTYPDEIDEAFAEQLGLAAGTYAKQHSRGSVVVGQDTRDASAAVEDAFIAGVRDSGANVVDVGVGPTDRTALATNHYGGIGCMITASHHAWERTGFKFLYEQGHGFSNDDLNTLQDLFHSAEPDNETGTLLREQDEFDEQYIETVKDRFHTFLENIDATVLVDAVGGAERTAPVLFDELGATVVEMDRTDRPGPEPSEKTRQDVETRLREEGADIAVGYDLDGDRVYVIHPELGWIDGDRLFFALGRIINPDMVVASLDTSPMIERLPAEIHYTRVGDVFVSEKGVDVDADLLGEPNGHYAVTNFCWYNSGIFTSLLLAAWHDRLPRVMQEVEQHETYRESRKYSTEEERDEELDRIQETVAEQYNVISTVDGVKFETGDATVLVRPSGTSPKIRLIIHHTGGANPQHIEEQVFSQ